MDAPPFATVPGGELAEHVDRFAGPAYVLSDAADQVLHPNSGGQRTGDPLS
jgi:hypothetical protein